MTGTSPLGHRLAAKSSMRLADSQPSSARQARGRRRGAARVAAPRRESACARALRTLFCTVMYRKVN